MNKVKVNLFCDEIKEVKLKTFTKENQKWYYLGLLIIPQEYEENILNSLFNLRCLHEEKNQLNWPGSEPCEMSCGYHKTNNTEIHYKDATDYASSEIAKKWIDYIVNQNRENIYFYILGLNLTRLDYSYFGQENVHDRVFRIYNRFFRTALQKSVKSYFSEADKIIISNVFHDRSDALETHDYFPRHPISKLNREDEKLDFECDRITFLDSDHRKSNDSHSHFLQLIDLILGVTFNSLHYSSENEKKVKIADKFEPLLSRLIDKPDNFESDYNYVGRLAIEFFPKYDISDIDPESQNFEYNLKRKDSFYKNRELKLKNRNQMSLF